MVNFFGAGGGGGGAGCVASGGGVIAGAELLAATAGSAGAEPLELSEILRALWDFLLDVGLTGSSLGEELALGLASGAGGGALAAIAVPTCMLLITCFTPGTAAACFEAASRWASLSTVPDSVTTPLLACTVSCLFERPESWLN